MHFCRVLNTPQLGLAYYHQTSDCTVGTGPGICSVQYLQRMVRWCGGQPRLASPAIPGQEENYAIVGSQRMLATGHCTALHCEYSSCAQYAPQIKCFANQKLQSGGRNS